MVMYIVLTVVFTMLIVFKWKTKKFKHLTKTFSHDLLNVPLLGILPMFIGNAEDIMSSIDLLSREANRKGGIISIWIAHRFFVGITDPTLAKFVLHNCLEKHDLMVEAISLVMNSSLIAPEPIWRQKRKHVQVPFRPNNLRLMSEVFEKHSKKLIETLQTKTGESISMYDYWSPYVFEALCENIIGAKVHVQKGNENLSLVNEMNHITGLITERFFKPWLLIRPLYKLLPKYKILNGFTIKANIFAKKLLDSVRKQIINDKGQKTDERRKSLLEQFVSSTSYSDEEIIDEVMMVLGAGTDSTTGALGFACLLLARHPDVQQKICEEVLEVIGVEDRPMTTQDYVDMEYLDAFVKETLRLLPPAPILTRITDEEITLPNGVVLPKDTGLVISVWGANRNPSYWGHDADLFRPERFLKTDLQNISFSYGPRNCVGYKYAMMLMKCALAALLRRYRILPSPGTSEPLRLEFGITMKHVEKYRVILEPRK